MNTKSVLAVVALAALAPFSTQAQQPAQGSPDEQLIRKSVDNYCAAFNNSDIDALLVFWSNDADYVDRDGNTHRGKQAIGDLFKNSFESLKGHKLRLKINSIRVVDPEVAVEDGVATLTSPPDGEASSGPYTVVWVKAGDAWTICSARELPSDEVPAATTSADILQPLEWLIGTWASEDDGPVVNLTSKKALDGNFLVQEYTVGGEGDSQLRVTQWIGYDAASDQIKSWTFDSRGGHGEGLWTRDGNTWYTEATGVLPDGRIGTALNSIQFVDDTHLEWGSTGRNVEGQPMPDAKVRFVRRDNAENGNAP